MIRPIVFHATQTNAWTCLWPSAGRRNAPGSSNSRVCRAPRRTYGTVHAIRRRRSRTLAIMPSAVSLTLVTLAPRSSSSLFNAVETRTPRRPSCESTVLDNQQPSPRAGGAPLPRVRLATARRISARAGAYLSGRRRFTREELLGSSLAVPIGSFCTIHLSITAEGPRVRALGWTAGGTAHPIRAVRGSDDLAKVFHRLYARRSPIAWRHMRGTLSIGHELTEGCRLSRNGGFRRSRMLGVALDESDTPTDTRLSACPDGAES